MMARRTKVKRVRRARRASLPRMPRPLRELPPVRAAKIIRTRNRIILVNP
jgi:hypothetical protein